MNNQDRRRIINKAKADGYQGSYVDLFKQVQHEPTMLAETPDQKQAGLRPHHEAGRTDASMAFTDVPPNTPFNTVGMKAPIDIKKYDEQGHLVKSYESVPPGIQGLDTGPARGTVLETPSRMQEGGFTSDVDPRLLNRLEAPQTQRTYLSQNNMTDRERDAADQRFKDDRRREEAVKRGVNPNTAFMTPPGLGADNEARAAYEYDNPATSNIGQIAGGIGFLPIDRGLDIALTAAAGSIRKGLETRRYKNFKSEIDWGKWNPDTPNHPNLMDEYKEIEYFTKADGTWMKNADGSSYKGAPEQFVQENSSHFKKAYPDGAYNTSRGIKFDSEIEPYTGKPIADRDLDPGFGYKTVFSADPELASSSFYAGMTNPEKYTPFSKRNWGQPQGFVADLYAKESPNSYRIVSQGDDWRTLGISGKGKDEIKSRLKSQKIGLDIEKSKPTQYQNPSKINQLETEISRNGWFAENFDKIINKTPSKVPNFEQIATDKFGRSVQTDFLGDLGYKEGLDEIRMFGLTDGQWGAHVNIHMNKPGNFLKSRTGNVGFFDMKSDDIFKAAAPIGIGAGAMSQKKEGGYKRAQQGSVVDYLLPALESNNPTQFADTQAFDQTENVKRQQDNLKAEEQRVQDVRSNVIPTAQNLETLNKNIKDANLFSDYWSHKKHFNKMRDPGIGKKEYSQLEKEAQEKYPELIEALPKNNVMMMNSQKYDADDELYCTPYGCYTYKKAGARDVPEYSGNFGFVGGARKGENPFQKISADEAVPGDVGIMYEHVVNDYRDKSKGKSLRPHHTAILSEKTDDPQLIKAYSAVNGERLNFSNELLKAEDKKDDAGNNIEGRWDYYRYIGQTPQMQRAVGDAKYGQEQADMVAKAMQQNAEVVSQLPKEERASMIDRRAAGQIKTDDSSQELIAGNVTSPTESKTSGKQKVEQVAMAVQGKVESAKEQRARVKNIKKKTKAQIKAIKKGQ